MKIAVGVFGIPRGAQLTFSPFMEKVVNQARKVADVQLFGHFFDIGTVVNVRSGESGRLAKENFALFHDFNIIVEPPERCLDLYDMDAIRAYGDYYSDDFKSVRNLVHQLHSLKTVTTRMQEYAPDAVIFARPDLLYHDSMPAWMIENAARHSNRCFLAHWQWWGGYNDRFAICGRDAYRHYGKRVDRILDYCSQGSRPLHAERLLRETLRAGGVGLRQLPVRASRVRIGDLVKEENFDSRRTVGPRRLLPEMALSHVLTRLHL